jgi:hypothetical protein
LIRSVPKLRKLVSYRLSHYFTTHHHELVIFERKVCFNIILRYLKNEKKIHIILLRHQCYVNKSVSTLYQNYSPKPKTWPGSSLDTKGMKTLKWTICFKTVRIHDFKYILTYPKLFIFYSNGPRWCCHSKDRLVFSLLLCR